MARARLTATREMDLDPANYRNVEWPAGSGERRDLTEPGDMVAYEQSLIDSGEVNLTEHLDGGNAEVGEQSVARWELVQEVQIIEPVLQTSNPFSDDPQVDEKKRREEAAAEQEGAGAKAKASGAAAEETDEEYAERQRGGLRDINTVSPKFEE